MLHPSLYRWAYASSLQLHGVPSSLFIVVCPHALFAGCCKILIGQVAFAQVLELYSMFYTTCFSPQTYNLMPTTALLSFKAALKAGLDRQRLLVLAVLSAQPGFHLPAQHICKLAELPVGVELQQGQESELWSPWPCCRPSYEACRPQAKQPLFASKPLKQDGGHAPCPQASHQHFALLTQVFQKDFAYCILLAKVLSKHPIVM